MMRKQSAFYGEVWNPVNQISANHEVASNRETVPFNCIENSTILNIFKWRQETMTHSTFEFDYVHGINVREFVKELKFIELFLRTLSLEWK